MAACREASAGSVRRRQERPRPGQVSRLEHLRERRRDRQRRTAVPDHPRRRRLPDAGRHEIRRLCELPQLHDHPGWPGLHDNQTWIAADPTSACKVDGLYGNYGRTWRRHYPGYSEAELLTLPRVTTETGVTLEGPITEQVQASLYLERVPGPVQAGLEPHLHLPAAGPHGRGRQPDVRLLPARLHPAPGRDLPPQPDDDPGRRWSTPPAGTRHYSIPNQPATVHDLLLQKSDGTFELVVWGERFAGGSDNVTVDLGTACATVEVYDPTITARSPTQTLTDVGSVALTLAIIP